MGILSINKKILRDMCEVKTPAIVYNTELLEYSINMLKNIFIEYDNIIICYSIKSNSRNEIVEIVRKNNLGIDVSSINEYKIAIKHKFKDIFCTSPNLISKQIDILYKNNIIFDFNSISQLNDYICNYNNKNIGLRINIPLKTYKSRFGVNILDDDVKQYLSENNIHVKQIHFHQGEKKIDTIKDIIEYLKKVLYVYKNVEKVNLGGGFKFLYNKDEIVFEIIKEIQDFLFYLKQNYPNIKVIIEPGEYISDSCAFLISSVLTSDMYENCYNVILDASYFNLYQWIKPVLIYNSSTKDNVIQNFFGNTCLESDIFLKELLCKQVSKGDKVIMFPAGAYVEDLYKKLNGLDKPYIYIYDKNKLIEV